MTQSLVFKSACHLHRIYTNHTGGNLVGERFATVSTVAEQTFFFLQLLDVRYKFQKDQSYGLSKTSEEKLQSRIPYR